MNTPGEDWVKSIMGAQSVSSMVMFKPVGVNKSLKSYVGMSFIRTFVLSALTASWLTVGAEGVVGAWSIVYVILAFIGDGPPAA